jgi:hypothetical protein
MFVITLIPLIFKIILGSFKIYLINIDINQINYEPFIKKLI